MADPLKHVMIDGVRYVPTQERDFITAEVGSVAVLHVEGKSRVLLELKGISQDAEYRSHYGLVDGDKIRVYWEDG